MTAKFCIKKNPTSTLNPWLCSMAPGSPAEGRLVYASLDDITRGSCSLVTFGSPGEAGAFIADRPDLFANQVVCEVRTEAGKIEMIPVQATTIP